MYEGGTMTNLNRRTLLKGGAGVLAAAALLAGNRSASAMPLGVLVHFAFVNDKGEMVENKPELPTLTFTGEDGNYFEIDSTFKHPEKENAYVFAAGAPGWYEVTAELPDDMELVEITARDEMDYGRQMVEERGAGSYWVEIDDTTGTDVVITIQVHGESPATPVGTPAATPMSATPAERSGEV